MDGNNLICVRSLSIVRGQCNRLTRCRWRASLGWMRRAGFTAGISGSAGAFRLSLGVCGCFLAGLLGFTRLTGILCCRGLVGCGRFCSYVNCTGKGLFCVDNV